MTTKLNAPYGSWHSPLSSQLIVSDAVSLSEVQLDGDILYHLESRPQEQGRNVIVKTGNNGSQDILPPPYSARSRVHEYGGGVYCTHGDSIFFVNDADQDIYRITENNILRLTQAVDRRFADLVYDPHHQLIIAVCEDHSAAHNRPTTEPANSIVAISLDNGEIETLCQGYDFYASPRLSPDGRQLCWLCWNHPNMPWDGTELWLAKIGKTGNIHQAEHIHGRQLAEILPAENDDSISVCQPRWSPDNRLYFISDIDGWWHLYRHESVTDITAITQGEYEIGLPQWVFAQSSYAFIDAERILGYKPVNDITELVIINAAQPQTEPQSLSVTQWHDFSCLAANNRQLAFIGASGRRFPELIQQIRGAEDSSTTLSETSFNCIKASTRLPVSEDYYSQAETISFSNRHRQTVFASYYPPTNPDYQSAGNEKPPLIVICHGGPTASASTSLDPKKQFWTSRGFALLDVNYSGSTGYGRDYRRRLNGNWGVLDVEDCCDAALYAVQQGLADKHRLIIRGSSAGGYTVLCALTFHQVFSASASYYGISELETLATDTHKFESRYLDRLVGPYPEKKDLYRQRSPIYHSENLTCPVIFFQGIDDKVVPKEQAEKMIAELDKKGIAVASRFFSGEQHGFRQASTITETLANELYFYSRIFGFDAEDGTSLEIKNL